MSNEEQLRAEFYTAFPKFAGMLEMEDAGAISHLDAIAARHCFAVWQAATASKQREIDALNQQVLELSAQVEVMMNPRRWTKEMHDAWHQNVPDMQKAFEALHKASILPSSALLAHDDEVAAKALEDAASEVESEIMYTNARQASWKYNGLNDAANGLRHMATERRNRK